MTPTGSELVWAWQCHLLLGQDVPDRGDAPLGEVLQLLLCLCALDHIFHGRGLEHPEMAAWWITFSPFVEQPSGRMWETASLWASSTQVSPNLKPLGMADTLLLIPWAWASFMKSSAVG